MAVVVSNGRHGCSACEGLVDAFDMVSLKNHLPLNGLYDKRLSMLFSGESRSFKSLGDVKSIEDLEKVEIPASKRQRKYAKR